MAPFAIAEQRMASQITSAFAMITMSFLETPDGPPRRGRDRSIASGLGGSRGLLLIVLRHGPRARSGTSASPWFRASDANQFFNACFNVTHDRVIGEITRNVVEDALQIKRDLLS